MAETNLLEPFLDEGIRSTHFFNGRLLAAEDLQTEQEANRRQHRQLGRAVGEGVVYGLEVRAGTAGGAQPTVWVTSGLALNRAGQALAVPDALGEVKVALVRTPRPAASPEAGLFAACSPPEATAVPAGTAVYLLVLSPASGFQERAPSVGLGDGGVARGCGSRYAVEGVQFRLVDLDIGSTTVVQGAAGEALRGLAGRTEPHHLSRFRNLLAHICLGTPEKAEQARHLGGYVTPVTSAPSYGPLDTLRGLGRLSDCDVPLALIYWTRSGIQFVDGWAVRRRVFTPAASMRPPFPATDRQQAEAEAAYLQFQQQLTQLPASGSPFLPVTVGASSYFRYLPAAGVLPLRLGRFDFGSFFNGLTVRPPVYIEGAKVRALLQQSFVYPPVDLGSGELIWLYFVRENGQQEAANQTYLLFANGHMPYQGEAQYDLSRWNYSNYASLLDE